MIQVSLNIYTMLLKQIIKSFTQNNRIRPLTAYKYLKSISQTALLFRPQKKRDLTTTENLADRVVQAFFDSSNINIKVTQSEQRLTDVQQFSTPSHSYYQIRLPFGKNEAMRRKMVQFAHSHIRVGRILELMDYIATNVAYRYCTPDSEKDLGMDKLNFSIMSAAIDSIEFYYPISIEIDCELSGYVSFVGKSSMEVHIDVLQTIDGQQRLACSANFVMVARDKSTGKAHAVPTLAFHWEKDIFRIINELGNHRQTNRKRQSTRGLQISPPTYEESVAIHKLKQLTNTHPENYHPIASTLMKNNMLMHIQDKNLSGKVFGGLILRAGYELGWLCASRFLKTAFPVLTHVDDVQFLAPVQIGTYLELEAKIGYVTDKFIHVIITCVNWQISGNSLLTNVLRVTFEHGFQGKQIPKVFPETVTESYVYIQSLRRVEKMNLFDI